MGLCLLGAAAAAPAQEAGGNAIGPAQLRDFSLTPKQTIVRQPPPEARPAPRVAPPSPATQAPAPRAGQPERSAPASTQAQRPPAAQAPASPSEQPTPPPTAQIPSFAPTPLPAAPAPIPAPAEAAPAPIAAGSDGPPYWLYGIFAAALALLGVALFRRRRLRGRELAYAADVAPAAAPAPAPPPIPRPDPVPRPWLELELKTIRASFSEVEAVVEFELSIGNTGGSPARNLKIDVKMFNAGREQDQEIGAFFRTAGRESTKLNLPGIHHGATGVIQGEVAMPLEEMKAMKLDGRMLFVPVVAVNALYEWGEGRNGQSSKSYVVGRELETPSEKMGAFRVDQGPRIWRTVGQRQHKLARRV